MAGAFSPVKLKLLGVNELLRAHQPEVDEIGKDIANDADGNYRYVPNPHRFTARGHIETADTKTAVADAKSHELLKSLGRNIR